MAFSIVVGVANAQEPVRIYAAGSLRARPAGSLFADYVLSSRGQEIIARHGFTPGSR